MNIIEIIPLQPNGTNSTLFTECCRVAICDDQECCPVCKQPVVGHDEPIDERKKLRWRNATRFWKQ